MKNIIRDFYNYLFGISNEKNRNYFVIDWLKSLKNGTSLLDAGAGIQRYRKYAHHLRYKSQDFGTYKGGESFGNSKSPLWDSTECDFISDITNIPTDEASFDNVMCTEVLEHVPDPQAALKELTRVLKKNGLLLLTIPFRSLYHQEPYFFYSGFSTYWIEYFAKENKLEFLRLEANGNYYQGVLQEIVRISNSKKKIFYFSKSYFLNALYYLCLFN